MTIYFLTSPPFHRLARVLYYEGATTKQIMHHLVYEIGALDRDASQDEWVKGIQTFLTGTPRRLKVVKKSKKKSPVKPPRNQVEARIEDLFDQTVDVSSMTPSEYLAYFGLATFIGPKNRKRLIRACTLWSESRTRELICGMLLADVPHDEIASFVNSRVQNLDRMRGGAIKANDIQSFEQLLWDFTGYSRDQISTYVRRTPVFLPSVTALRHGVGGVLFRLGYQDLDLPAADMFNRIRTTAFLELDRARYETVVDANEFRTMFAVFQSANAEYEARAAEDFSAFEQEVAQIKVAEADDFRDLDSVLMMAQTNNDLELLRKALQVGLIKDSEHRAYLAYLEEGNDMRHEDRAALMQKLSDSNADVGAVDEEHEDIRDFLSGS